MKRNLSILMLVALLLIMVNCVQLPTSFSPMATTTYSKEYGSYWTGAATKHVYKISYVKSTQKKGLKKVLGTLTNSGKKGRYMSASYTKSKTRTYSLGVDTKLSFLKKEVKATIGGSVSDSSSVTLNSGDIWVGPKKSATLYYRINKTTCKYKNVKTTYKNSASTGGKWKKTGSSTSYSYIYENTPEIIG